MMDRKMDLDLKMSKERGKDQDMNITMQKINPEEIPTGYKKTRVQVFLEEFLDTGWPAVEVVWNRHYKSPVSAEQTFKTSIKLYHMDIKVIRAGSRIFLVNPLAKKEKPEEYPEELLGKDLEAEGE